MKKVLLSLLSMIIVVSQGISSLYAFDNELYKMQNYYKEQYSLANADEVMAVEALGLEVEEGFGIYDMINQDYEKMQLASLAKNMIALCVSGYDPRDINGQNIVQILESYIQDDGKVIAGNYVADVYTLPWVVYALYVVESPKLVCVSDYLASLQDANGGFGSYGWTDSDTTAQVLEALVLTSSQRYQDHIQLAKKYLKNMQDEKGYFLAYDQGSANADTQANVLIGLLNDNKDDVVNGVYDKGENIYHLLLTFQNSSGSFGNGASNAVASRVIGSYYYGDFFKDAKQEYQDLLDKNKNEQMIKRKNSFYKLDQYYQSYKVQTVDDVITKIAMGESIDEPLDLSQDFSSLTESELSKTILAMVAQNQDTSQAVEILESYIHEDGSIGNQVPATVEVWCLFALYVVESPKLELVADHLAKTQADNGMYGFPGYEDLDTTGWVIAVLSLVDKDTYHLYLSKAIDACIKQQQESGAFGIEMNEWDVYPNANTQASVLLGLITYDKQGLDDGKYSKDNHPMDVLLSFQNNDGTFGWDSTEYNALATTQVAWTLGSYYRGNVFTKLKNMYKQNISSTEDTVTEIIDDKEDIKNISNQKDKINVNKTEYMISSSNDKNDSQPQKQENQIGKKQVQTQTKVVEDKKEVSDENKSLKYILIVLAIITILLMIRTGYMILVKKDNNE